MGGAALSAAVRPGSPELGELLAGIAEGSPEREREQRPPHDALDLVRERRLGALRLAEGRGGAGATVRQLFETIVDLAAADCQVAHILRTHYSFVEQRLAEPDCPRRERWLAEVAAGAIFGNALSERGSRPAGLASGTAGQLDTTLTPNGDGGYLLDGVKYYSTGSLYSDYIHVIASLPDGRAASVILEASRPGVTIWDDWDGFGQGLTGTGTTRLDRVPVAREELTVHGAPDAGAVPTYQFAFLQLYLVAVTAGILAAARNDAADLVRGRTRSFTHSAAERPAEDPQVLQVVGEISSDAFAARAIVLAAAEAIEVAAASVREGVPDGEAAHRAQLAAAQAKVSVDRFSFRAATAIFDAGGASATSRTRGLDRHWRNARTIAGHNPTAAKASAVGGWYVGATPLPLNGYF